MNQDFQQSQESLTLDATGSSNFNTTTGYATGTTCTFSGTYRASNRYMDIVGVYAKGDVFSVGPDGKKTTWYALTSNLSTNTDGGFTSVKVDAGTI